jgi:predicted ATPase
VKRKAIAPKGPYLLSVSLLRDRVKSFDRYPFSIPCVRNLKTLKLDPKITFLVGDNGSGKSTLIEAIAVAAGFNAEGGTKNFSFSTRRSESELHTAIRLARGERRERDGFFLRAESLFNVATNIEELDREPGGPPIISYFGGISLHEQSHGESFFAVALNRFAGYGLYILDEPEAALSPSRQLAFLRIIDELVRKKGSQFIIATHSPILMAYPKATIYLLTETGMTRVPYEKTEHYRITRGFLEDREEYLRHLFADDGEETGADSPPPRIDGRAGSGDGEE